MDHRLSDKDNIFGSVSWSERNQVNGQPLANIPLEIGSVRGLTGADGKFTLDLGQGPVVSDTLKVTEQLTPQVFAALETHVNNWLTFRMGANKGAYQKVQVTDLGAGGREVNLNQSSFNMNLGAGVKLGTLQLDAVLNNLFPQTLGGWFSNDPSGFIAFPKVTATYAF